MFYNALIQAFLPDETLFSDVKAIVDCPLKADPTEVIKACREKQPRDILELLDTPGSDLERPTLLIPPECRYGLGGFLLEFDEADVRASMGKHPGTTSGLGKRRMSAFERHNSASALPRMGQEPRKTLVETKMVQMVARGPLRVSSSLGRGKKALDDDDEDEAPRPPLLRRATASAMWGDRLAELVTDMNSGSGTQSVISDHAKAEVLVQYFRRIKNLGEGLIQLWPKFYRRVSTSWAPDRSSLIPLPRPFVVPGGRFIEIYYWDSYWILLGLLSSGLESMAQELIENFLFCVERFGFIPNGTRKYYLDRSQPPLLSCMLRAYYHATRDVQFIQDALQMLEREYAWWMSKRGGHVVELEMPDPENPGTVKKVILNRYYSLETTPRPESYRIDEITGSLYQEFNGAAVSLEEHFRAIRAAAESGWDFSSRWLRPAVEGEGESGIKPDIQIDKVLHKVCLVDIDTCWILPVDLNAFMFCLEEDLAYFARLLDKPDSEKQYLAARERRREAMLHFLWDPEREMWLDYDTKTAQLSCVISAASFVPLWAGVNPGPLDDERRIQLASRLSCLLRPYGVVCTNVKAGLQWDCPNVWAPNLHMAVDFLCGGRFWDTRKNARDDQGKAIALGINWASRFINTVLDRYEFFGTCSEKYDCARLGKSGLDGEYVTQSGFGWTNGSVLDFMRKFGTRLSPAGLYSSRRPAQDGFYQITQVF